MTVADVQCNVSPTYLRNTEYVNTRALIFFQIIIAINPIIYSTTIPYDI